MLPDPRASIRDAVGSLFSSDRFPEERYDEPLGDEGLFGTDSVTWQVHADVSMFVGGIACIRSLGAPAEDDHAWIVLDEVAGLWIALAPAALDPIMVALAFILFRVFDALKPWPISWLDRHVPGPLGIMADDVAAGLVSAVLVVLADLYL